MKKVIIVAPHFPPSNLAAVHRSRLFAQHLPSLGWEPIVLTVHHDFYEEELDWNLYELLPDNLKIERVNAFSTKPYRVVGDIGIRAFYGLYKRIVEISKREHIDFLYITIPSNYTAPLGRLIKRKTGISYGIDYIDPWVHSWPGTETRFNKHWWSMKLGEWLEPWAVKNASLITGVAPRYYEAVLERNPHLKRQAVTAAMPYGGEKSDHDFIVDRSLRPYLFEKEKGMVDMVYAGALLPKAHEPLKAVLKAIRDNIDAYQNVRLHFIGTGKSPNDSEGYNIRDYAIEFNLWQKVVFEYPKRIPYLDVLAHLQAADGALVLGSTEPHYTPSKVYQAVLSKKRIFALLHEDSTACRVINEMGIGITLAFNEQNVSSVITENFTGFWAIYNKLLINNQVDHLNAEAFERYSAKSITIELALALNEAVKCESSYKL